MPHSSQHEPDDDDALREPWRGEELTNGEKVRDASNGQRNDGKTAAPWLLKLREQIVSATSKMAPSPYSLRDGVSFTGLPCPSATVPPPVPTVSAKTPFVAP